MKISKKVIKQTEAWAELTKNNVKDMADTIVSMTKFISEENLYCKYLNWDLNNKEKEK